MTFKFSVPNRLWTESLHGVLTTGKVMTLFCAHQTVSSGGVRLISPPVGPCSPQLQPYPPWILPARMGATPRPPPRSTLSRLPPAGSSTPGPSWPSVWARCCLAPAPPCPCSTSPRRPASPTCWAPSSSLWVSCSWSPAWSGSPCSNRARVSRGKGLQVELRQH